GPGASLPTLSGQAFRLVACRDYVLVDFRVKPTGKPYILEVNPNPDFSPVAGLAGGMETASMTHAQVTVEMIWNALARAGKRERQVKNGEAGGVGAGGGGSRGEGGVGLGRGGGGGGGRGGGGRRAGGRAPGRPPPRDGSLSAP